MYKRNKYKFGLAAMIVLFVVIGLLTTRNEAPKQPAYVSFSAAPDGTKAIKLLLQEKGHIVKEWKQPWIRLPAQGQSLLLIEPEGVGSKEMKELLQWVEDGNHLLLFQRNPIDKSPFATKELDKAAEKPSSDAKTLVKGSLQLTPSPTPLTQIHAPDSSEFYRGEVTSKYRIKPEKDVKVLWEDDQGVLAAQTKRGEGSITVFLTPDWLTNDKILTASHFEMVWSSLLSLQGDIWVDEYHHGYDTGSGLLAVYPGWLLIVYVQLLLALLFWLWWKGKRFGSIAVPREWVVRRGDETLLAVAHWYQRSGSHKAAILNQERYFRQMIQERWGIRTNASIEEILTFAERKWEHVRFKNLQSLLYRLEEMKQLEGYTTKQFVQDSHVFTEMVQAVEKE
ncbi:MAG: hypothetical protein JWM44_2274 [Bacilli bacterium]|nr:hypothetical protein [Bacilli bacterium]